jgi:transposase
LLPLDQVDEVIEHVPKRCEHCRAELPSKPGRDDPPPIRHQRIELPEKTFGVTEHQAHARTCLECGEVTRAEIPLEFRSAFGPRLVALVAMLTGVVKASRRATQEFVQDVLEIPVSLGAVSNLENEVSGSLAEAHAEAGETVREAPRKNVDETGWKQAGKKRWLWAAATPLVAFFVIHPRRGKEGFFALIDKIRGIFTTDRWHVYASVKTRLRQVCWAHLKRDFTRLAERAGKAGEIGEEALEITAQVFWLWKDFKANIIDRRTLNQCLRPLKLQLRSVLERGVALDMEKVSIFCENLLALEPALWNFAKHESLEPTNNHAERVLRPAVLWRKRSFGADSDRGCRYVERMLTAVESCRLQKRRVYDFLVCSLQAYRTGSLPPSLVNHA